MTRKITSILLAVLILASSLFALALTSFAEGEETEQAGDVAVMAAGDTEAAEEEDVAAAPNQAVDVAPAEPAVNKVIITKSVYDEKNGTLTVTLSNTGDPIENVYLIVSDADDTMVTFADSDKYDISGGYGYFMPVASVGEIGKGKSKDVVFHVTPAEGFEELPAIGATLQYVTRPEGSVVAGKGLESEMASFDNICVAQNVYSFKLTSAVNFFVDYIRENWLCLILLVVTWIVFILSGKNRKAAKSSDDASPVNAEEVEIPNAPEAIAAEENTDAEESFADGEIQNAPETERADVAEGISDDTTGGNHE